MSVNISLVGDKLVVLWQALVLLAALAGVLLLAPWLLGRMRDPSRESASLRKRMSACGGAFLTAMLLSPVVHMAILASGILDIGETALMVVAGTIWMALTGPCVIVIISRYAHAPGAKSRRGRDILASVVILACALGAHLAGLRSLGRVGTLVKRSIDAGNLNAIGRGLELYGDKHAAYPDDLRLLVADEYVPWKMLLSAMSGTMESDTQPKDRPVDFVYIRLPEDAPLDLVWVWQPPAHHKGEGSYVLLKSGKVRWMKPVELLTALARTGRWLTSRPTTQPAHPS